MHYDFNNSTQEVIRDISGYGNNAYLENGAQIQPASDVCGSKAVLSPRGDILMEDFRLENKPKNAITIAARIRLPDTRGWHSIFSTAKTTDSGEIRGQFTLILFAKYKTSRNRRAWGGEGRLPPSIMFSYHRRQMHTQIILKTRAISY